MKNSLKVLITALVGLSLACSVYAEGHGKWYGYEKGEKKKHWERRRQRMEEELGLTEEQKEKIKVHGEKSREAMKELREKNHAKREELKKELEKKELDKKAIDKILSELKDLEGKKIEQRIKRILFMREVLTDEQHEKFINKVKELEKNKSKKKRHKKF